MKTQTVRQSVNLPEVADFLEKYPRYTQLVSGEGRFLFDLIMQPENLFLAKAATHYKLPAVLSVAECCRVAIEETQDSMHLDNFAKQFIGAAICVLMEANGYRKTGKKKSVPHVSFSTGEFYVQA